TPGDKGTTVVVTYPDGSKDEVPVKVTVKDPSAPATDADKNTPTAKDQTVKPGDKPSAKDSIGNVGDLPKGTTVEFKTPVDTTTPGDKGTTVVVTYPDGSKDEVPVKVTVKDPEKTSDADKNTPTAKDQTVKPGDKPSAKDSIGNVGDLPKGTTVEFKTPVDTTTPGDKGTTVVVTYPDGSKDEVPVKVTVKDPSAPATDADKNTPTAKDQTVKPGDKPSAKDSIGNVGDLPKGTTVEFKTPVDTTTPGDKGTTVVVTYPDGSKDEVPVKVTVKDPTNKVVKDPSVTPVTDPSNLTDAEKAKVADEVKKANPTAKDIKVNNDGSVVVTFEDGTTAVIPADKTVKKSSDKVKESDGVKNPSVTPVTDPSNLTDAEKAKVADEVKKANPTAKDIKVNNDGSVVVTFEDGSVAVIPAEKAVTAANQDSPAQAPAKKAGAKELPNTGTEQSSASLALALLAAATGGLLFAKKREEEE
ncbi:Rib/alpha-like domain-containing protein, partial [Streptococcus infantis]|uniref:Rib/alpha-like domain-containing protein n=2 Tax=Streptococcus infantis TaxID=68892 RepID=UPI0039C2C45A